MVEEQGPYFKYQSDGMIESTPTETYVNPLGKKSDSKKARWDLLPMCVIEKVVRVLTHGARNYGANNWKYVEQGHQRYYAAAMRHISRYRQGFKRDKETGQHHLVHAICCLIFMVYMDK